MIDLQLKALIEMEMGLEKSWSLKELLTSLNGDITTAVSIHSEEIDLEEIDSAKIPIPIQELHLHIGQVEGNTLLGNTVVELSTGIVQERA